MGLYFAVFTAAILIACASVLSWNDKYVGTYTSVLFAVLTAMLCLRYGQGTDYFMYSTIYASIHQFSDIFHYYHGEPLYLSACFICNRFMDFRGFVALISLAEMTMLWGFIRRRSVNRAVSVMLLLTVMYTIYLCNLMRQGLAISIFLRYGTEFLERREWKRYMIMCFVLIMFHTASAVYVLVPFVLKFRAGYLALSIPISAIISTVILRRRGGGGNTLF